MRSGGARGSRSRGGSPSHASAGRLAAYAIVSAARAREAYTHDLIEPTLKGRRLSREDRAFATMLSLGVAASSGTLDDVIDRALDRPGDVKPDVRDALRLSTFEIVFLQKDAYAAVDQGVELVRCIAPRAAGLANAVLRRVVRLADEFPFGDPSADIDAFARLYAFPTWLARLLIEDIGLEAARDLMEASNGQAPVFVAVNAAKASDEEIIEAFREVGCDVEAGEAAGNPVAGCYRIAEPRALADGRIRHLIAQGKVLVSDASSQAIARLALPDGKPASFLEVGSGRATKTILLQSNAVRAWGSQMKLAAIDSYAFKGKVAAERAAAYGIRLDEMLTGDASKLDRYVGDRLFDAAFIDAPCSGLGTLRRHPEIRWRLAPSDVGALADVGLSLLESTARHIAPGGQITYATCTVAHAENNGVVKRFLEGEAGADFALAPIGGASCFATRVSADSPDAHFAVRFVRRA